MKNVIVSSVRPGMLSIATPIFAGLTLIDFLVCLQSSYPPGALRMWYTSQKCQEDPLDQRRFERRPLSQTFPAPDC